MKRTAPGLALALALPLLVAPLAALTWLAARGVDQQESAMRARLRESLLLEVTQTNDRIASWFDDLPDALAATSPRAGSAERPSSAELSDWKSRNPLVGVPFLLDSSLSIAYPDEKSGLFHWRYLSVFSGEEQIPVYSNIATEYETSIVAEGTETAPSASPSLADGLFAKKQAEAPAAADAQETNIRTDDMRAADEQTTEFHESSSASYSTGTEVVMEEAAQKDSAPRSFGKLAPPAQAKSAARSKAAQSIFETDAKVQKQVYELAAEEGKAPLTRNVNPQISAVDTRESAPARSVYVESMRYFSDLVSESDRGIVPRIFDNSFVILYWEKRGDWIVGCELDMGAVRDAVAARAGSPADGVRFLAVLDQTGSPLVPVATVDASAWRTPLVSGEISEFLPYWETAVILADPSAFESRVRSSRYALSALVVALFLSAFGGVAFLVRYSSNRLLEARRRTGFVTTVSHELKTPLTSIRMYSEMLAGGADLDREKRDRYLGRIVAESERLTRLINDVLDAARLERGTGGTRKADPVPVDLASVARETLDGVAERLRAGGFTLSLESSDGPVMANADRDAVTRIVLNLISNAEKYSADEREITVTVGRDARRRRVFVSVADRGIGVPRAHRKKIFREFHRVDSSVTSEKGGTGLGLSIARSLARTLAGDVAFAPREGGRGSVFTLSLPASGEKDGSR